MRKCPSCQASIHPPKDSGEVVVACASCLSSFSVQHLFAFPVASHHGVTPAMVFGSDPFGSFPYMFWFSTTDQRSNHLHLELERLGLDGTNIFRRDDPFFAPWFLARELDFPQCRCCTSAASINQAAQRGVKEAIVWYETGKPPSVPHWVEISSKFRPFESNNDCELCGTLPPEFRHHPGYQV
jgi:hypothetical protein